LAIALKLGGFYKRRSIGIVEIIEVNPRNKYIGKNITGGKEHAYCKDGAYLDSRKEHIHDLIEEIERTDPAMLDVVGPLAREVMLFLGTVSEPIWIGDMVDPLQAKWSKTLTMEHVRNIVRPLLNKGFVHQTILTNPLKYLYKLEPWSQTLVENHQKKMTAAALVTAE
jgi:hypothetical protein